MTRHGQLSTAPARRRRRAFTLVEMMVVIAIMGMIMSIIFGMGSTILPKQRLEVSAWDMGGMLTKVRSRAVFLREELLFVYDLDADTYASYHPYESDDEGRRVGPGRTEATSPRRVESDIVIEAVRLADGELREEGEVALTISPLGRIAPHDVIVANPEFADVEVRTVRVNGLSNRFDVLEGRPEPELLDDAHFR